MDGVDDRGAVGDRTKGSAEWGVVVHEVEHVAVANTMFCPRSLLGPE